MKPSGAHWTGVPLAFAMGVTVSLIAQPALFAQDAPALPSGLSDTQSEKSETQKSGPALPEGLEEGSNPDRPSLPPGLGDVLPTTEENQRVETPSLPPGLSGFLEGRVGRRTQNDPHEKDLSIGEARLQVRVEPSLHRLSFKLSADFLYDPVLDAHELDLERGEAWIDLREANVLLRPGEQVDLKIGRQILTWGTGDLVFINDLFPKDWNAFFIGRDTDYLKAPSDAVKVSLFSPFLNLDLVYTPRFDPDRTIDGRRISYFNIQSAGRAGQDAVVQADTPDGWFHDDEIAGRLYRNINGLEAAVYSYRGYWKSPAGFDANTGRAIFPALSVYGASFRGTILSGVGNAEMGYYDSEEDRGGDNPFIRNSEFRFIAAYEQELLQNLSAGLQYYLEHLLDYDPYTRTLPAGSPLADKNRHVLTLRLTQLSMNQNLILSLFTFYSPSDQDAYLRPNAAYTIDDYWSVEVGGNFFFGNEKHTFFGQFEKNNNVFVGVRYGF